VCRQFAVALDSWSSSDLTPFTTNAALFSFDVILISCVGNHEQFRRDVGAPDGLLALDPQLLCYSWMTGIPAVAQVVFVCKRRVEVQYLRTTIRE
jgi:hypothetical protein